MQPPPPRKAQRRPWTKDKEDRYLQGTWRFQRGLVKLLMVPAPFCLLFLIHWHVAERPGWPPLWIWAVLLGSIAFTLAAAFFYWRCPACGYLLYRTSKSGVPILFWLSDPDECPDCGFALNPPERLRRL